MRSLHIRNYAGQMNLRGKKVRTLSCGCCEVQDFRENELDKEAVKEMKAECTLGAVEEGEGKC